MQCELSMTMLDGINGISYLKPCLAAIAVHLLYSIICISKVAIPKKLMKAAKQKKPVWPLPKRGKTRSLMKCSGKKSPKKAKSIPYVRHSDNPKKAEKRKKGLTRSIQSLCAMNGRALVRLLREDGVIKKWEGKPCPRCEQGTMGSLKLDSHKKNWGHRCSKRGCQTRLETHAYHPIFSVGRADKSTPLGTQAAILSCAVAGVPVSCVPSILDVARKTVDAIYTKLEIARTRHVKMKESKIVFGAKRKWTDIEADEVDLGKEDFMQPGATRRKVRWEQWGGIVERGQPHTLRLYRLKPTLTRKRAPGPGPISRRDWAPIAQKCLANRNVILHTDGARACKLKLPGVLHDNVVHQKKRVKVNGKYVWMKPHYTKVCKHKLPDGQTLQVQAGTQVIDRFWGTLRKGLRYINRKPGSLLLERKIRAMQWVYWHRGQNMWQATSAMLKDLFAAKP